MRFGKFNLVGLIGAVLQIALLTLLTRYAGLASVAATPIAVEAAILHNFVWHERFTWRDRVGGSRVWTRLLRFHAANGIVSLGGNTVLMYGFVNLCGLPAAMSAIAAIGICALVNFRLADRWVYT